MSTLDEITGLMGSQRRALVTVIVEVLDDRAEPFFTSNEHIEFRVQESGKVATHVDSTGPDVMAALGKTCGRIARQLHVRYRPSDAE